MLDFVNRGKFKVFKPFLVNSSRDFLSIGITEEKNEKLYLVLFDARFLLLLN